MLAPNTQTQTKADWHRESDIQMRRNVNEDLCYITVFILPLKELSNHGDVSQFCQKMTQNIQTQLPMACTEHTYTPRRKGRFMTIFTV